MLVETLAFWLESTAPRWQQVKEMAELQVDQLVWILDRLPGVVLEKNPYVGTRIGLEASLHQIYASLQRVLARRKEIMICQPVIEVWTPRHDLCIGERVLADFTFAGRITETPQISPNNPEAQYGIEMIELNALRMRCLYSVGELMPYTRIHKPPQAA